MHIYSEIEQRSIIANYYLALANTFPREFAKPNSVFFRTIGFGALMNALPTFFSLCIKHHKGFTVADATRIFHEVAHFDFSSWENLGTGSAVELQAGDDLRTELLSALEDTDDGGGSLRV